MKKNRLMLNKPHGIGQARSHAMNAYECTDPQTREKRSERAANEGQPGIAAENRRDRVVFQRDPESRRDHHTSAQADFGITSQSALGNKRVGPKRGGAGSEKFKVIDL